LRGNDIELTFGRNKTLGIRKLGKSQRRVGGVGTLIIDGRNKGTKLVIGLTNANVQKMHSVARLLRVKGE
jgi:hypothetical protein